MKTDKRKLDLLVNAAINSKFEPAVAIEAAILTYAEGYEERIINLSSALQQSYAEAMQARAIKKAKAIGLDRDDTVMLLRSEVGKVHPLLEKEQK